MTRKFSPTLLLFILVSIVVFLLESWIIAPHLKYGFADVDWGFLLSFKQLSSTYQDPISHLLGAWRAWGVYTYQVYYTGLVEHFFPIDVFNFINIHKTTHFFKILSALSLFPLVLVLTEKRLLAAIATILYAVSYPSFGPIYTVAVSGNYPAIAVLNLFIAYYVFIVKKNKTGIGWPFMGMGLFILTLFLSTERMYPLIPLIILGELFWVWTKKFSRPQFINSLKRVIIFFLPIIIISLLKILAGSSAFGDASSFFPNTKEIIYKLSEGNWSVALTPIIAFGSLFLPREFWGLIGSTTNAMNSFGDYFGFFLGPFSVFFFFTILVGFLIAKKPLRFILTTSIFAFIFNIFVFLLASHHLSIAPSIRLDFDSMFLQPALLGAFVLALSFSSLIDWVIGGKKEPYSLFFFLAPVTSFLIIFLTWIPSAWNLIFEGVHRYLAIPAIGSSFFTAALITLMFEKVNKIGKIRNFSFIILFLIIPLIQLDFFVIGRYFTKELNDAGMDGPGQKMMKTQMLSSIGDFDFKEPSMFYFDEEDRENGYFQETAIIAGFNAWMRFRGRSQPILTGFNPQYIRNSNLGSETNVYCTGANANCIGKLKDLVVERDARKGILYNNTFFPADKFYVFKLKNRQVIDIRPTVFKEIGLSSNGTNP